MRPRRPVLTENELEIMKLVWKLSPVTVRDVYEELRRHRKVAYTTVMTMMGILEEKGLSDPDAFVVGCLGRLVRWKGQHVFLEAVQVLAQVAAGAVTGKLREVVDCDETAFVLKTSGYGCRAGGGTDL